MPLNLIALITDFGLEDNFVAAIKGVILTLNPQANLIDISHNLASYSIKKAAFKLLASFSYFPQGTVFLVVIDPGVGSNRRALAIKTTNYYFVGPDNGVLSLAVKKDGLKKIIVLKNKKYFLKDISATFHGRDIFAPVAAYLSKGKNIDKLGPAAVRIIEIDLPSAAVAKNKIKGEIIYADKFGNLTTNITSKQLAHFLKYNRSFTAILNKKPVKKKYSFYNQADDNEPFLIEGSSNFLEIALKNDSAKDFFGLKEANSKFIIKPAFCIRRG